MFKPSNWSFFLSSHSCFQAVFSIIFIILMEVFYFIHLYEIISTHIFPLKPCKISSMWNEAMFWFLVCWLFFLVLAFIHQFFIWFTASFGIWGCSFFPFSLLFSTLPLYSTTLLSRLVGPQFKPRPDECTKRSPCRTTGLWQIQAGSRGSLTQLWVTRWCLILVSRPGAGDESPLLQHLATPLFLASSHGGGG